MPFISRSGKFISARDLRVEVRRVGIIVLLSSFVKEDTTLGR